MSPETPPPVPPSPGESNELSPLPEAVPTTDPPSEDLKWDGDNRNPPKQLKLPGWLSRGLNWMDQRMNPIVVKEVRQAVRSRFVVGTLMTLLVVLVVIVGIVIASLSLSNRFTNTDNGAELFFVVLAILAGFTAFFVPLYTGVRFHSERNDSNTDLLFITTIKPRTIINGKVQIGIMLLMLLFSLCLPFMTFSYLLQGIDLPTIFCIITVAFAGIVALIYLMLFIACIPSGRLIKILFGLAGLGAIGMMFGMILTVSRVTINTGIVDLFSQPEARIAITIMAVVYLLACLIVHVSCVAIISSINSNRMLPVRVTLVFAWTLLLGVMLYFYRDMPGEAMFLFLTCGLGIAGVILMAAICEREEIGPRVKQQVPRNPLLRALAFPFYTGSFRGIFLAVMVAGATIPIWHHYYHKRAMLVPLAKGHIHPLAQRAIDYLESMTPWSILCLYVLAYGLTAIWLRRKLLARRLPGGHTWALCGLMISAGVLVPLFAGFFIGAHRFSDPLAWHLGAVFDVASEKRAVMHLTFVSAWLGLMLLLHLNWIRRQIHEFAPPPRSRPVPSDPDPDSDPPPPTESGSIPQST